MPRPVPVPSERWRVPCAGVALAALAVIIAAIALSAI